MRQISQTFGKVVVAHLPMITFLSAIVSFLSFRIRSRASLELEVIALRHQLTVLKRRRPGRARFFLADRLLWIWLYRIRPQAINAMVLVKPTTVKQWHRAQVCAPQMEMRIDEARQDSEETFSHAKTGYR